MLDSIMSSIIGYLIFGLFVSFVCVGLAWLIGWRKYPKWRVSFWWIWCAFAGVLVTALAIRHLPGDYRGMNIAGIILFVAAIILIFKRPPIKEKTPKGN